LAESLTLPQKLPSPGTLDCIALPDATEASCVKIAITNNRFDLIPFPLIVLRHGNCKSSQEPSECGRSFPEVFSGVSGTAS